MQKCIFLNSGYTQPSFPYVFQLQSVSETTHHRAVGIRQELPELREQILLVLEEASNLRVHLLLRQRRRVVPSCLLGIALLLLPRERGEASEGHTNYLSDKFKKKALSDTNNETAKVSASYIKNCAILLV